MIFQPFCATNSVGWEVQWLSPKGWKNCVVNSNSDSLVVFDTEQEARDTMLLDVIPAHDKLQAGGEFRVYESLSDHP
jgi:hypothetical protein